ncbi:hypothetical protein E3P96_00514 [Wallemia ichthyophaga]|nr:hypothetical protein E3P96_00514 [Wallemia ichthyophaga]
MLISKLESVLDGDEMEVRQEIYDAFVDALSLSKCGDGPPQSSYKTYYYNQDPLTLYEDQTTISKGTTGLVTWISAQSMARDIYNPDTKLYKHLASASKVLELGAGCGLVSMVVSKLFNSTVYATDVDENVLQRLERNVNLNNLSTRVVGLDWFNDRDVVTNIIPDVVVAADVVYDDYLFSPLLTILQECLRMNHQCKIYIRGVIRNERTYQKFISMLREDIKHDINIMQIKNECTQIRNPASNNRPNEDMYEVLIG